MDALQVLITVDVEMWPPAWDADAAAHRDAFRRYIHGVGTPADYGLPYQLRVLADHGLKAVFFVEPLFASVLGRGALEEVVGMIVEAGQDVQLHLHPEWLGRAGDPELPGPYRLAMSELDADGQAWLIGLGRRWLEEAGAPAVRAFRAGGFGADFNTLRALAENGIGLDFSQSRAARRGPLDPAMPEDITQVGDGVVEVPLTTYRDFLGRRRPLQVGSSSYAECRAVLDRCLGQGRRTAAILSHSAELLNGARTGRDAIVERRFRRLCQLLDANRDVFRTTDTSALPAPIPAEHAPPVGLRVPVSASLRRYAEQAARSWGA